MSTSRVGVVAAGIAGCILVTSVCVLLVPGQSFGQGSFNPNPKTANEAIEMLVMANRILSNEGVFDYLGHAAVRNPENPRTFFIARAIAPETVTKADILEVDLDGNVVTKSTMKPYSERIIHAAIFKARPDVNATIHAHPIPIIVFSISDVPLKTVAHFASRFYEGIPVYDEYDFKSPGATGMLVTTKEEGDRVARCLGKSKGMLMRGHGFNVVGSSIPDMVMGAINLRDNALVQLSALQMGKVKYLTYEEGRQSAQALTATDRGWNYWVARVKKAMPDMR
jgi:ribulose-5-phosphate 4-epimerase/fuculose-1-phosphate aldolase